MPVMLRILLLIGLMIWSPLAFAQSAHRSPSSDRWTERPFTSEWISSWVAEHVGRDVDLDDIEGTPADPGHAVDHVVRPSAYRAQYEAEYLGPQDLNQLNEIMSAETERQQPASNLVDENMRLMQQLEATRTVLTILDMKTANTVREREILAANEEQNRQRIVELERQLSALEEKSNQSKSVNEKLTAEMDGLRQTNQQRVAALESKLGTSQQEIEELKRANEKLAAEKETRQPGGWIAQLLGYHRGYVDALGKADVAAGEERQNQTLTKRLKKALGRDFAIPDLTTFGMAFVGGHVVVINGVATGRINYRDTDGNPLGFWLTPRMGQSSKVNFGQNGDLNIVHWQGKETEYALIGSVAWSELALIAGELHRLHGE